MKSSLHQYSVVVVVVTVLLKHVQSDVTELNWAGVVWFLMNWPMGKQ